MRSAEHASLEGTSAPGRRGHPARHIATIARALTLMGRYGLSATCEDDGACMTVTFELQTA